MGIAYKISKQAAALEAQEGRPAQSYRMALAENTGALIWDLVGREHIRPRDLQESGELVVPRLEGEQGHVLTDDEAVALLRAQTVARNVEADAEALAWVANPPRGTSSMSVVSDELEALPGRHDVRVRWTETNASFNLPYLDKLSARVARLVEEKAVAERVECARLTEEAKAAAYAQVPTRVAAAKAAQVAAVALVAKRRAWLAEMVPVWGDGLDLLSDSGVVAEIQDHLLAGGIRDAVAHHGFEVLRLDADVIDEGEKVENYAHPRERIPTLAKARKALRALPALELRKFAPEVVSFQGHEAWTVEVALYHADTEIVVGGRVVLDRGEE